MSLSDFSSAFKKYKEAFDLLLYDETPIVDGLRRKRVFLVLTIVWVLCSPFLTYYISLPYQGEKPSNISLIKINGHLVFGSEYRAGKGVAFARIIDDSGNAIEIQNPNWLEKVRNWEDLAGSDQVYVEGFLLRNGSGLFWPTLVTTNDGVVLLSKSEQENKLDAARNPFGRTLLWMYLVALPMIFLSFKYLSQIVEKNRG